MILMYDHWSKGFGGSAPLWVLLLDCEDSHDVFTLYITQSPITSN
jgi:hypothetical protein